MKFKCKICGYIHEGDAAPEICPKCRQKDAFVCVGYGLVLHCFGHWSRLVR